MNFQQLQSLVSYWVDDPNFTYFTPVQVQQFLNNAQQEVNKKLTQCEDTWYRKCAQTYTIQSQQCYALPSDFEKINHMEIVVTPSALPGTEQKVVLTHSTMGEADIVNYAQGQPVTFTLEKNCILFYPVPDNAYLARMHYSYRVSDMVNASDLPDVPLEYHEYLAILASIDCFLKDQRPADQFVAKRTYYEELLKQSATDRMVDKPREVVQTWDDGFGVLF